ncbi:MAG: hypothetical protein LQ342_007663 [Letrouitia transgressa]|nr:MAG: hypothetical protein LQ342_007663 [Letrouitia transgressa]
MDAAGLVVGIPGLIQTCVHGYRFVCEMIDLDRNAYPLHLRYRIEESRLTLWGRFWGLLMPGDETTSQSSSQSLDDLLEIPGIEALVTDILNHILVLLRETQEMSKKYERGHAHDQSSANGLQTQSKMEKHSTSTKLRWALKDKTAFISVLDSLTSLNDGLDKLLPRQGRVKLSRALVGEVLSEEGLTPGSDGSDTLAVAFNAADTGFERASPRREVKEAQMPEIGKPIARSLLKNIRLLQQNGQDIKVVETNKPGHEE